MSYWWVGGWIYLLPNSHGEDLMRLGLSRGKASDEEVRKLLGGDKC